MTKKTRLVVQRDDSDRTFRQPMKKVVVRRGPQEAQDISHPFINVFNFLFVCLFVCSFIYSFILLVLLRSYLFISLLVLILFLSVVFVVVWFRSFILLFVHHVYCSLLIFFSERFCFVFPRVRRSSG